MTTPNLPSAPDGSFVLGSTFGQDITEASAKEVIKSGNISSWSNAQGTHKSQVKDPLDNVHLIAVAAQGSADAAVTEAQAAANAAAAAESTAAAAYDAASYWETEFVTASAEVLLGVNELLIGLCQNVPTGLVRKVTDIHAAFLTQPNGMEFQLKKWNPAGTSESVVDTFTLTANQTRANWTLDHEVFNRERLFVNVTSVTGAVAPVVLQILVFGVLYDPSIQTP